jgi:hypothetical protein
MRLVQCATERASNENGQNPLLWRAVPVILPRSVAGHINTDAIAVLEVIRNEAQTSGQCMLSVAWHR